MPLSHLEQPITTDRQGHATQSVKPFRVELCCESFPPTIAWVDTQLSTQFGRDVRVIHWAIVESHPLTHVLVVEGAIAN